MNGLDLPELLGHNTSIIDWQNSIRPKYKALFEKEEYGEIVSPKYAPQYSVYSERCDAISGKAIRREVVIDFGEKQINTLMYLPKRDIKGIFIGLNFQGNHTITDEEDIDITTTYINPQMHQGKNPQDLRGVASSRWPIESIINRGYGIATAHYGDFFLDTKDDYKKRLCEYLDSIGRPHKKTAAIAIWASMLMEIASYFKNENATRKLPLIVFGHSRLGKTALLAGAFDSRFDMVVSNDSGCGGAAIFKRSVGETISVINDAFPHWFNDRFKTYADSDSELDFDQHMLLATIAPRPLYVASASEDTWADPEGEFLCAKLAEKAYELYGYDTVLGSFPPVDTSVGDRVRYHVREGKHDITEYDFECYMDMADDILKGE